MFSILLSVIYNAAKLLTLICYITTLYKTIHIILAEKIIYIKPLFTKFKREGNLALV